MDRFGSFVLWRLFLMVPVPDGVRYLAPKGFWFALVLDLLPTYAPWLRLAFVLPHSGRFP